MARTRFSPSKAGPIASACGGYSSSIPCFSRISTIRGSRPRSATRISHLMRRGPHKGSRGRRERVHIPGDPWRCLGTASTECPVGSVLPGLAHEPGRLQKSDWVVVVVLLRNPAAFHVDHGAPSKLDPIPGGGDDAVPPPPTKPPVEAMAQRPFVRSLNQEFHADPVALSEAAHPRPREIRQGIAPGLESLLNRFATFRRLGQVRARHDDTIHVKTPQMVPVPLVDCFERGINHAKVLFHGHLGFPLPVSAWKLDYLDGYRCGSLVQPPEGGPDQPPDSPDPKPLGHPSFRSARWWTSGPRSPGYGFVTRRCSPPDFSTRPADPGPAPTNPGRERQCLQSPGAMRDGAPPTPPP